ncbi:hypothetical protein [Paraburkholderia dinghuensis]|uniref:Uncharacterized protein n=1 Tax=Paraburkholderia dinghuensis TaxID=2305225 RepID=A0A3N6Q3K3_9BURK|nr:hypothetical protein [Paraburkholderia dinghuensis]RQH06936.1 hypothetical protein D1Y85_09610 [Paraburkholderia dinghuensis]
MPRVMQPQTFWRADKTNTYKRSEGTLNFAFRKRLRIALFETNAFLLPIALLVSRTLSAFSDLQ